MELLKRFEESNAEEADLDEEEEEEDALTQRLKGVDLGAPWLESHTPAPPTNVLVLDSMSPDDLWNILSEEQRTKFLKTMENPLSDLTKQLLADGGSLHAQFRPWWNNPGDTVVEYPAIMSIPRTMVETMPNDGPPLLYNICAVW